MKILRTHTKNLPVYSDYKQNRKIEQTTIIRHIRGDINVILKFNGIW